MGLIGLKYQTVMLGNWLGTLIGKFAGEAFTGMTNNLMQDAFTAIAELLQGLTDCMYEAIDWVISHTVLALQATLTLTPKQWNETIFEGIKTISDKAITPIALIFITFVGCYEIYNMVIQQNSMAQDGQELFTIFRIVGKLSIAAYLLSNNFDITAAFFDLGSYAITEALGVVDAASAPIAYGAAFETTLLELVDGLGIFEQLVYMLIMAILSVFTLMAVSVMGFISVVVLSGRFIEIYIYLTMSPLAFASFGNQEMAQFGKNYVKNVLALAFQGFFIVVIVAIYVFMMSKLPDLSEETKPLFKLLFYNFEIVTSSFVLGTTMYKSRSISKSIFNAN